MIIKVRVTPNAKSTKIITDQHLDYIKIYVHAPNIDNKANEELINFLALHYNVKKNKIKIVRGFKTKNKIIEIKND